MGSNACRRKFLDWKPVSEKEGVKTGKDLTVASGKGKGVSRAREDFGVDEDDRDRDDGDFVIGKKGRSKGRSGTSAGSRRR